MSPEVIGGIVASILAIVAASAGTYMKKRKVTMRPPPMNPDSSANQAEPTGRFRLVEQIDRDQTAFETLDIVTQLYRQFAELSKDNARDALSRETVAQTAERVEAIYSRVRRLATSDDVRELTGEVRALRRLIEGRGNL